MLNWVHLKPSLSALQNMNQANNPMKKDSALVKAERLIARAHSEADRPDSDGPSGKAGEIVAELEHRLITGHYKFGDPLSIYSLAEQFDASRQPISAAINHLRGLGYLKIVPQVGCQVVSPSPQEIADFFYMLAKIECGIAGFAAARHDDGEPEVLIAISEYISATPFDNAEHREDWAVGVDAYHGQIRAMARSPGLEQRVQNLWRLSDFYLWQGVSNLQPKKIATANRERQKIANAIAARDVERSEQLMEQHVRGKPQRVGIV